MAIAMPAPLAAWCAHKHRHVRMHGPAPAAPHLSGLHSSDIARPVEDLPSKIQARGMSTAAGPRQAGGCVEMGQGAEARLWGRGDGCTFNPRFRAAARHARHRTITRLVTPKWLPSTASPDLVQCCSLQPRANLCVRHCCGDRPFHRLHLGTACEGMPRILLCDNAWASAAGYEHHGQPDSSSSAPCGAIGSQPLQAAPSRRSAAGVPQAEQPRLLVIARFIPLPSRCSAIRRASDRGGRDFHSATRARVGALAFRRHCSCYLEQVSARNGAKALGLPRPPAAAAAAAAATARAAA